VPLTRPVLEFRDVSKSFRQNSTRVDALVRVSLAIWPGDFAVLTGPSGSGKSTLIHLAAGLEMPTSGTIELAGVDLRALEDDELSRLRCSKVSLIFQAFHVIDETGRVARHGRIIIRLYQERQSPVRERAPVPSVPPPPPEVWSRSEGPL